MKRALGAPLAKIGLLGLCPRCAAPTLFKHTSSFREACPKCGLDFTAFDVGDAAAPFLIFLVGTVVVVGAIWLELSREPAWWVHALLWVPLTIGLTLLLLRIAKALLVAQEYRNDARLGRHE